MAAKTPETEQTTPESFQRFSLRFRVQHIVLFLSVTLLIVTGLPLWLAFSKPSLGWSDDALALVGGMEGIRLAHRAGAAVLIVLAIYHIGFTLFSREGRREFCQLLPRSKDFSDAVANALYFLGKREARPRFGRFAYYEKFDYWAVWWGCVIMIGSGLALWFDQAAAQIVPWLPYSLAVEIHADEAMLAALALFIWHFYNVHLSPSRFPGTLLWWHGKISREEMLEDHPLEYEQLIERDKKGV